MSRAIFASNATCTRGRRIREPVSATRSDFRRDCDRIIHSTAFRRLAYKTQVFLFHEGDHYRTRLTHTLEVAQVARALARALDLDEDLAEALALAHDLGHPPFGHAGERALDVCLSKLGGFDHNAQTLRVVTVLERRYPTFEGLNLTWETLEGLIKHNGPLTDRTGKPIGRHQERGVPKSIVAYSTAQGLDLWNYATAEAQVAAVADDIAYNAHDIDDGLRAELFQLDDIAVIEPVGEMIADIRVSYPRLDADRQGMELIRRLIGFLIEDVIAESGRRLGDLAPQAADDVRNARLPVVGLSAGVEEIDQAIKRFLKPRMYYHPRLMRVVASAESVVTDLFARYSEHPDDLPSEWQEGLGRHGRGRPRPPHCRFHRRYDRPLRARRTHAAF